MEISLSGLSKKQKRKTAMRFLFPGIPFRGEEDYEISGRLLERLKKRNTGLIGKINKKMRERKRLKALQNEPDVATVSLPTESVAVNTPIPSVVVDNSGAPEGAPEGAVNALTPAAQKAKMTKTLVIVGGAAIVGFIAYKSMSKKKRR
jgi:hypothetical protein